MEKTNLKTKLRRDFLLRCLQLPIGGSVLLGLAACDSDSESSMVCADESLMTSADKSLRTTLQYTEMSPDPAKTCSDCEFFTATAATGCGSCEMFGGKPANSAGYCVSWSVDPEGTT